MRSSSDGAGDRFPEKLIKYVPAETLAFFVPVAAAIGTGRNALLVAALVLGMIFTPLYLWLAARKLPTDKRPLFHFYLLAAVAFVVWALGTSSAVADLVQVEPTVVGIIFMFAVFIIPGADAAITEWRRPTIVGDAK
jgi:hypothetical protein